MILSVVYYIIYSNKTDCHNITEILLNMALSTIALVNLDHYWFIVCEISVFVNKYLKNQTN
jgi:hypothetical protein